jgi:outer membrane receptor protein involved in Fe transport
MLICSFHIAAQTESATISGRVVDPSGLNVIGAQIELVDVDHSTSRMIKTNNVGLYTFPNTSPGHYRIMVTAPGFRVVNLTGLTVNTQDNLDQNFKLAIGSMSESITVEARSTAIDVSGSVGTVVDQTLVKEMPLNGRSFQSLIQLTPGVVTTPTNNNSSGQFSVNGQRSNANYFMVDGASANAGANTVFSTGQTYGGSQPAFSVLGGTNSLVSSDAVQEFALQTSSYSPEFGRNPGAQISIVTKSGANELHGDVFEYVRNELFDANDWFANHNGIKRAPLRQNDFGGVVGGPIQHNKTFFFFSYEGLRLRQPTTGQSDVPTVAARQAAPAALQPLFNAYPLPTGPDEFTPCDPATDPSCPPSGQKMNGLAPAVSGVSNPSTINAISLRVDHHFGNSVSAFARYNFSPSNSQTRGGGNEALSNVTHATNDLRTLTLGVSYAIKPTLAYEARFNWTRSAASSFWTQDNFGGATPLVSFLPAPFTFTNGQEEFQVSIQAKNGDLLAGRNIENIQRQLNFANNVSWQRGGHLFKFGLDYRRLSPDTNPISYGFSAFFSTIDSATTTQTTASGELDALDPVSSIYNNYSLYAQDAWRLTPRLNLTYGVRWDYNPTPNVRSHEGLTPIVVTGFDTFPNLTVAPNATPIFQATKNNFAPRLGIAYQLFNSSKWQTAVRAGAGMFYDLATGYAFETTAAPFRVGKDLRGHSFPYSSTDLAPPPISRNPPFAEITTFAPTMKLPYTYQWNLSLDQALGSSQTVTVGYVGSSAHSLVRPYFIGGTALPSEFAGGISFVTNEGYSNYNAFQAQFRRRSNSIDIVASYTLSHSLDNGSSDTGSPIFSGFIDPRTDYASSDFDIRHTASVALDYRLPAVSDSSVLKALTSGWAVDPVVTVRTSPVIDVLIARNIGFGFVGLRPDPVPNVPQYVFDSTLPGGRRINEAAFTVSSQPRQGNLGRNSYRGFGLFQADLAVRRQFKLTERLHLQARAEAFNMFNHPNFAPESHVLGLFFGSGPLVPINGFGISPSMLAQGLTGFGSGTGFSSLYQIGGARSMQLALKLDF